MAQSRKVLEWTEKVFLTWVGTVWICQQCTHIQNNAKLTADLSMCQAIDLQGQK